MHTRSWVGASALLLAALGCRDETELPTAAGTGAGNPEASVSAASALAFWQVTAGYEHSCGVTTDNRAYCWGDNGYGDLGDGTQIMRLKPVGVIGDLQFRSLSAGFGFHTCGVTTEYRVYCWGWNEHGQLGDGTRTPRQTPTLVVKGLQFRQVDAGWSHTCGVTTVGRAYCWGDNYLGQLGDGTTSGRRRPVAVSGGRLFRQVAVGYSHTCGVTRDNQVLCWGQNRFGQVGDSTRVAVRLTPTPVAGGHEFRQVDAGGLHNCAVTTDNRAFCWGGGENGQIGNGVTRRSYWPKPVRGGLYFTHVTAGGYHSCGETATRRAYCWGDNGYGQLGDGTQIMRPMPVPVAGNPTFRQVSAGFYLTCGKTNTAVGYCWGNNWSGQLGDGSQEHRFTPTPIAGAM